MDDRSAWDHLAAADRTLLEETLELCEQLLADATTAASELRHSIHREALDSAERVAGTIQRAATRQLREAAADRAAASSALAEALSVRSAAAAELEAAGSLRAAAGQALEQARLDALAARTELATEASHLQEELLAELDDEVAARLDEAARAAAVSAAAELAAARQAATELLDAAKAEANEIRARATTEADRIHAAAQSEASALLEEAKAATRDQLAEADALATRGILDAYDEARRIVDAGRAERARRYRPSRPRPDAAPPQPLTSRSEPPPATSRRARRGAQLLLFVLVLSSILGAAGLTRAYVAQPYTVSQTSMAPALVPGDRLVVNKLAVRLAKPQRGDIVLFRSDVGGRRTTLVKRVIGLPGEEIEAVNGSLLVNGELVADPWASGEGTPPFGPFVVPHDTVFVMGDNRAASLDSRVFGPVDVPDLIGRVDGLVWPPSRAGLVG